MSSPAPPGGATPSANVSGSGAPIPLRTGVEYRCGDCSATQILKGGDPVRCRQCGFRILYKIRTKRCKCNCFHSRCSYTGSVVTKSDFLLLRKELVCVHRCCFLIFDTSIWSNTQRPKMGDIWLRCIRSVWLNQSFSFDFYLSLNPFLMCFWTATKTAITFCSNPIWSSIETREAWIPKLHQSAISVSNLSISLGRFKAEKWKSFDDNNAIEAQNEEKGTFGVDEKKCDCQNIHYGFDM